MILRELSSMQELIFNVAAQGLSNPIPEINEITADLLEYYFFCEVSTTFTTSLAAVVAKNDVH